jgi:uncharacterized membrane protein YdjX (TVP38/TMEM64 family)
MSAPDRPSSVITRLGPAGLLGIAWALMPVVGLAVLGWHLDTVTRLLTEQRPAGILIYVGAFALTAGLALMPTWAQSLLGGWAFGLIAGGAAAVSAIVLASWIGYEVARVASRDRVESVIRERPKWRAVRDELIGAGFLRTVGIVTVVRLPPNSPFALTNLVLAGGGVGRPAYVLGTLLGITPRTLLTVFMGSQVHQLTADTLSDKPWWVMVLSVVLALVAVAIIGTVAKRALSRLGEGAQGGAGNGQEGGAGTP